MNSLKIDKIKRNLVLKAVLVVAISACLLMPCFSYAAFEQIISTGARSQGMGEAFVAISDNADALLINPAGIINIKKIQVSTTLSFPYILLENDNLYNGFISLAIPLMEYNAIGIGWNGFFAEKYDENILALSYAHRLVDSLTLAGTLKLLTWNAGRSDFYTDGLADYEQLNSMLAASFDLGVLYKPSENISVGFVLTDINQPNIVSQAYADKGGKDLIPFGMRAGASYKISDILMDVDYIYKYYSILEKTESTICVGAEKDLNEFVGIPVSLRGGVNFPALSGTNVSVGASYKEETQKEKAEERHQARIESEKTNLSALQEEMKSLQDKKDQFSNQNSDTTAFPDKKTIALLQSESSKLKSGIEKISREVSVLSKQEEITKQKEEAVIAKETESRDKIQAKIQPEKDELKNLLSDKEIYAQSLKDTTDKNMITEIKKKLDQGNVKISALTKDVAKLEQQDIASKKQEDARKEKESVIHKQNEAKLAAQNETLAKMNSDLESVSLQLKPVEEKKALDDVNAKIASLQVKIDQKTKLVAVLEKTEVSQPFNYQIDYAMIISFLDSNLLTHRISFSTGFDKPQPRKKVEVKELENTSESVPQETQSDDSGE